MGFYSDAFINEQLPRAMIMMTIIHGPYTGSLIHGDTSALPTVIIIGLTGVGKYN